MDLPIRRATDTDVYVARRLRIARYELGLTLEKAADHLGFSYQQIQKYERGANRISAATLFMLAHLYAKPVGWFFEGLSCATSERRAA